MKIAHNWAIFLLSKTKFGHKSTESGQLLLNVILVLYYVIVKINILGRPNYEGERYVEKGSDESILVICQELFEKNIRRFL